MLACDAVAPARRIARPAPKPKTIRAVRPNLGIEAEYRRRLDALVSEMNASLEYWLTAAYRANEPEIAQDGSPAMMLQRAFTRLARRWQRRFDEMAPKLARWFAAATADRTDAAMKAALKQGGMTVEFKLTRPANDVVQATVQQNVALIKSIASENLAQVNGIVMRSVTAGRDMGALATELQSRFGVTKDRAALIARDQSQKATAAIVRVRQVEIGVTEALWIHSTAGRHPRPSHVAMSGKRYSIKDGVRLDGEVCWPGTAINCRCVSRSILPWS